MNLCKYKHLFGSPGQGIHSYRLFDVAIVDVLMTVLVAILLAFITRWSFFWPILAGLFLAGVLAHRAFCVRSTVDNLLFTHEREE